MKILNTNQILKLKFWRHFNKNNVLGDRIVYANGDKMNDRMANLLLRNTPKKLKETIKYLVTEDLENMVLTINNK